MLTPPVCRYCIKVAELVTGDHIYPHRPDLHSRNFWRCESCGAYVGCHPGTDKPLGILANAELRQLKLQAHQAFDPLWQAKMRSDQMGKNRARKKGYLWLADQLGIKPSECHIGMMDESMCRRVIEICEAVRAKR